MSIQNVIYFSAHLTTIDAMTRTNIHFRSIMIILITIYPYKSVSVIKMVSSKVTPRNMYTVFYLYNITPLFW